ncbi:hypothetical protein GGR44_001531 [Sphingobium fontiphilum]|uniref:eCIS core domain-containing protein n=1 Tax=Sphingobium fontiphilum TaxID=944425 RepID=A0A7W6GNT5_9SPHN|nr:DUF4157 domain-containing protein [Sphingobium fontiphilum]MBB3981872.1 hypothetical protein [Sphingobium fontiphilum]
MRRRIHTLVATTSILCALSIPEIANASWLSEITGIDIDLNRGTVRVKPPNIGAIPDAIRNLPKDVGQALINPAAPALATAIRFSRGQALNRGAQPIPPHIRQYLGNYFPASILEKVRWTTANGISIDGMLKNWFNQEGAVTLDEVIVFSSADLAMANTNSTVELWAHELTHVMQYQNSGVETFAFNYSVNFQGMESQARDNARMIMAAMTQGNPYQLQQQAGSFASQIPWASINEQARQAINPVSCIWINGWTTGNACPVAIRVSGVIMVNMYGQSMTMPCNEPTCVYGPNQSGPLLSPPGWKIVGVTAAFQF